MTFTMYLPWIIVLGYALTGVLAAVAGKLRTRATHGATDPASGEHPAPPTPHGAVPVELPTDADESSSPAQQARARSWSRAATWAAVLVGVGTTVVWLAAALDPSGWITLGAVFLGLIIFSLVLTAALDTDSGGRKFLGTVATLILAADFWFLLLPPLLYLVGLAKQVQLRVTEVMLDGWGRYTSNSVQGYYTTNGVEHQLAFSHYDWGSYPEMGATIEVGISPLWPSQVYAGSSGAWFMLGIGIVVLAIGSALLYFGTKNSQRDTTSATST